MAYANLSKAELQKVFDELSAEYKGYQAQNLSLNMARGKPSAKQLELALGVLEAAYRLRRSFSATTQA